MPVTNVQGLVALLKLSADGGTTKKTLTCVSGHNFNLDTPIQQEQTQCGVLTGIGSPSWSWDFTAVVNTTPTGASEVSYEDMLGWANGGTLIQVTDEWPIGTGTDWHHQGNVYVTNLGKQTTVGEFVKFTGTLTGTGLLDITPA